MPAPPPSRPRHALRRFATLLAVVALATPAPSVAAAGPDAGPAAPFTAAFLDGEDEWLMRDRALTFMEPAASVYATLQAPFDPGQAWISVSGTAAGSDIAETASIRFAAPIGQSLAVGAYEDTTRFRDPVQPSLSVSVNSSGCNESRGRFEILELERDGEGNITRLAMDFEHQCEVTTARLFGSLRLNATTPLAALAYAPVAIDHGPVNVGTPGDSVEVAVTNTGTSPQAVLPRLEGPDADEFEVTGTTCPAQLAAGAGCAVTVRFAPIRFDAATANLILGDSTARGWREIDLSGIGLAPTTTTLTLQPASDFPAGFELTATVSPVPRSGSIRIWDGATLLGDLTVPSPDAGSVTMYAALSPGAHELAAEYVRGDPYQASRSAVVAHVAGLGSRVRLDASALTAAPGEDIRLFAQVDVAGSERATAGRLTIRDVTAGTDLASLEVVAGLDELRAVAPDAAGHTIVATYTGAGDVSGSSTQVVVAEADTVAPVASLQLGSGATWCTSDWLMLRVEASDAAPSSGIDAVRYSADGVTWEPWSLWQGVHVVTEWPFMERSWTFSGPDGPRRVWAQVRDAAGGVSAPVFDDILLDRGAPAPRAPSASLARGGTLGAASVPVAVSYGTTDGLSGVADYRLDVRTGAGAWVAVPLRGGATAVTRLLRAGTSHALRTGAEDVAGNWSGLTSAPSFALTLVQDGSAAVRYGGTWVRRTPAWASGTSVRRTTRIGASARFAFTGREVGIVAATGPDGGRLAVYLDGARVGTVDLYSRAATHRHIVRVVMMARGSHVLRLVTVSPSQASSGQRVVLDAFVVMR